MRGIEANAELSAFADLAGFPIRKWSRSAPALITAVIHRGCARRPDQVLPDLSRYFGAILGPASLLFRVAPFGLPRFGGSPCEPRNLRPKRGLD